METKKATKRGRRQAIPWDWQGCEKCVTPFSVWQKQQEKEMR
jgi:hypothetical protein